MRRNKFIVQAPELSPFVRLPMLLTPSMPPCASVFFATRRQRSYLPRHLDTWESRYKRPLSPPRNQKHFRGTETQTSHTLVAPRHCETGHSPLTTQHTEKKPWAESPAASVALAAAVTAAWTTTSGSLPATTSSAPCTSSISLRSATASSSEGESGPPPGDASLRICRTVPLIGPATPRGDIVLSPADGPTVTAFSLASWIA